MSLSSITRTTISGKYLSRATYLSRAPWLPLDRPSGDDFNPCASHNISAEAQPGVTHYDLEGPNHDLRASNRAIGCEQRHCVSAPEFIPALHAQLADATALRDDAADRGWHTEVARHSRVIASIERHLTRLTRHAQRTADA
jgi:hypothetical protein